MAGTNTNTNTTTTSTTKTRRRVSPEVWCTTPTSGRLPDEHVAYRIFETWSDLHTYQALWFWLADVSALLSQCDDICRNHHAATATNALPRIPPPPLYIGIDTFRTLLRRVCRDFPPNGPPPEGFEVRDTSVVHTTNADIDAHPRPAEMAAHALIQTCMDTLVSMWKVVSKADGTLRFGVNSRAFERIMQESFAVYLQRAQTTPEWTWSRIKEKEPRSITLRNEYSLQEDDGTQDTTAALPHVETVTTATAVPTHDLAAEASATTVTLSEAEQEAEEVQFAEDSPRPGSSATALPTHDSAAEASAAAVTLSEVEQEAEEVHVAEDLPMLGSPTTAVPTHDSSAEASAAAVTLSEVEQETIVETDGGASPMHSPQDPPTSQPPSVKNVSSSPLYQR
ncbi:hypothetical protein AC578_9871 [Pseudocercospora eumusae]|uniref:Uncharacterized protein n=1 Tax=Pseudocercospora eumusae TaxID=321146 RepID=A0A139HB14_9PEZI|nr:hypothetical protein AC578_9871 [Pseudocercospora eumusae]